MSDSPVFDPENKQHRAWAAATPAGWAWATGRGKWQYARHLRMWNDLALGLVDGNQRILLEAPVRHGKTSWWAVDVAGWFLGRFPDKRVVIASYAVSLPHRASLLARQAMAEYGPVVFGHSVSKVSSSVTDWSLEGHLGGGYFVVGVGGALIGRGADCLTGDSVVVTDAGGTTLADFISAGCRHLVLSYDHATQTRSFRRVRAARAIDGRDLVRVVFSDGRELRCTPDHRICSAERGYVESRDLRRGEAVDALASGPGEPVAVALVERVRGERVYDIQVEGTENFYANGVLVHNCLILDDLLDQEGALSDVQRENAWDWIQGNALRRLEPNASVVGISTRYHADDMHGRLLKSAPGSWRHINLPALARENDPLGREPGEALWPERYPSDVLQKIKAETPSYWWAALYDGNPIPEGGGIFKSAWWRDTRYTRESEGAPFVCQDGYTQPLSGLLRFLVVDTALTQNKTSDYTVIMACGLTPHRRLLVLDVDRRRLEGPDVIPAIRSMLKRWDAKMAWVEQSTQSLYLIQQARRDAVPIRTFGKAGEVGLLLPSGGGSDPKVPTYYAATPMVEAGRLWLPRQASWLADLEAELGTVPFSVTGHDDAAETCSVACLLADRLSQGEPLWAAYEPAASDRAHDPRESIPRDDWHRGGIQSPYNTPRPY